MEFCIIIKYFYHILSPPPDYLTSYPPSNSCYFSSFLSKNRNQNLTRKLFSIDTFWEKEKYIFFPNGGSLDITTRFQGKPYIQEQLVNTKHIKFLKDNYFFFLTCQPKPVHCDQYVQQCPSFLLYKAIFLLLTKLSNFFFSKSYPSPSQLPFIGEAQHVYLKISS